VLRLYLREGCASLFTYCTQVLHLAEGAAYNRIEAARAARRFPIILDAIVSGDLTVTAVRLLAPHLTPDNHRDVLAAARHQSKREVERIVATLVPKPAAPTCIRKLPAPHEAPAVPAATPAPATAVPVMAAVSQPTAPAVSPPSTRPAVTQLAPERYKVQFTISRDTHDKLRRVQDLMRHAIPNGDPAEIFDRALTLLLHDLDRRRCAATAAPCGSRAATPRGRHIPAAVRREVWKRDEGRCTFVGTNGRCSETGFLELHHVEPYAVGGVATAENILLRCRAHNAYEAALFFGRDGDEFVRETGRSWPRFVNTVESATMRSASR
jgi:5-methylcytosine-specific restriction endonuclease McrA